jgi:16S rRNA processing protein RimM
VTESNLILVARVAGAFGVRGEVRLTAFTQDPLSLLDYGALRRADGALGLTLVSGRAAKGGLVARVREISTPEQADALRGLELFVSRDLFPEPEDDEFYLADLIGLRVVDGEAAPIGRVKAVQNFGAGDLLEIDPASGGPSWWLAFTRETVPEIRIADGYLVVVRPPEIEGE